MNEELEFTRGSADPFADREDPAAASKALKAKVMTEIVKTMRTRNLTVMEAVELIGIGRSQVSRIKNGRLGNISLDTLVNVLDSLTKERGMMLRIDYRDDAALAPSVAS